MNKKKGWRFGIRKNNRILCMLLILLLPVSASAEPTTAEQARRVVQYWLHQNQQPLETKMALSHFEWVIRIIFGLLPAFRIE